MKRTKTKQLGEMLVEKKIISEQQLKDALELQSREGGLIGQILIKLKYVTQEDIEVCIYEQAHCDQKIEEFLRDLDLFSSQQLEEAKKVHSVKGGMLLKIIVEMDLLTEEDIVSTMVTQKGFPFLELSNYELDKEIVKLIPKEFAKKHCLIVIDKIGDILTVAMADPLDAAAIGEIKKLTGLSVETFISTISDIDKAIESSYA